MYKNNIFLDVLNGKETARPAVWMMRQAGRYLPDFRKLKNDYDFFTRCQTPEIASDLTIMPIHQIGVDAAILFSDILVVPQAMDITVEMRNEVGPWVPRPIRSMEMVNDVIIPDISDRLHYVFEAIKMTKEKLQNEVPLIGFAGSPWTIFCYAVEGKGSKTFDIAKSFCFQEPDAAHKLLQKFTTTTIAYLEKKIEMGCDAIQLFDSWGGLLSPDDYQIFSWPYINQIIEALSSKTKIIVFGKACWFALDTMAQSQATALGVDWSISPQIARKLVPNKVLQGNFDPAALLAPIPEIQKRVKKMIDEFGSQAYIANLGHGILPNVPVSHAKAFVDAVKNYSC